MKLKKVGLSLVALATATSLLLTGCSATSNSASAGSKTTINLYSNGSDNVRITWEAVLEAFKAKNPNIDVKLQFVSSGTGGQSAVDRLIAATKAGQKDTDIDIMETTDNDISRLDSEGGKDILSQLPADKIPNLKNINSKSTVGGDRTMVFRGSTVLLAYNSDKVATPPKTDKELYEWIKSHPGRFAYNDPTTGGSGDSFVFTALYNMLPAEALTSSDPKWKDQWQPGFDQLKELHSYMYKASGKVQYPAKNQGTIDLLASGEVDIIPAWADMILDQKSRGLLPQSIKLTQITPAFTGGVQTLAIPSLSKNKEAAYKLLDFVASPEGQKLFVEKQKAIPVIDNSQLPKETLAMLAGLDVKEFRSYSIGKLNDDEKKMWQETIATLK
ncbi:extracellular solute-binding protein [Desulfitobacterium sp.]|uniref:extracellular solute-binding protein n=1 Tax=Desulfitobacterium sp. TaxID=49981 RepID=UPI002C49C339|nr:extracellular solute-binding protein [Desulfitobacterium sp.]HVJ48475.1 extracellular solute-binding protein [Desulfitobacterium sp.]